MCTIHIGSRVPFERRFPRGEEKIKLIAPRAPRKNLNVQVLYARDSYRKRFTSDNNIYLK